MNPRLEQSQHLLGNYSTWAAKLVTDPPRLSLRKGEGHPWRKIDAGKRAVLHAIRPPIVPDQFDVRVISVCSFNGVLIEELSWQLPWGPESRAFFLREEGRTGKLPAVLAFHDHGSQKYFGREKLVQLREEEHPVLAAHRAKNYGGLAWANELAKRGFAVLVPDVFSFGSRRILLSELPESVRRGCSDPADNDAEGIEKYNQWAAGYEPVIAKSLFAAGTSWPGIMYAEDRAALDVLASRPEVDPLRIGCGGLSGGGLRTVFLAGLDERIRCAVCAGMMTTWKDFLLHKSYRHTWMAFCPGLAAELDYPDIFALRVPRPALILNAEDDRLFSAGEMRRADDMLRQIYTAAGALESYESRFYPGDHRFDGEMQNDAADWLEQFLTGGT